MIQLLVQPNERPWVEAFFSLFRIPWEWYREDATADILVTTLVDSEIPAEPARVIQYGEWPTEVSEWAPPVQPTRRYRGIALPLYGPLSSLPNTRFEPVDHDLVDPDLARVYPDEHQTRICLACNLFYETSILLTAGQPVDQASIPTLDLHIDLLRRMLLKSGLPLPEIRPEPADCDFMTCLTHDVDFVSLKQHGFDHTVRGFLYRAVVGSLKRFFTGRLTFRQLLTNELAALRWPLVALGWAPDCWLDFERYRQLEAPAHSTFFVIPYKERIGRQVGARHAARRATRYDIGDITDAAREAVSQGSEISLHGIDAWNSIPHANDERQRVQTLTGQSTLGTRMHWLCRSPISNQVLDEANFDYDSTCGYNETIGYRAGTSRIFQPPGTRHLLELPLHIQDVALFYPVFLNLRPTEAWSRCMRIFDHAAEHGGVVTLLWHMRSLAPERLWGDFYRDLLNEARQRRAWLASAREIIDWARVIHGIDMSAQVGTEHVTLAMNGPSPSRPVKLRIHRPGPNGPTFHDESWQGAPSIQIPRHLNTGGSA